MHELWNVWRPNALRACALLEIFDICIAFDNAFVVGCRPTHLNVDNYKESAEGDLFTFFFIWRFIFQAAASVA